MKSLLIRDLILSKGLIPYTLILIPLGYILSLPPFMISLAFILQVIILSIFFLDHRAGINSFVTSLPLKRKTIMISRYISFAIVWIFTVLYQFAVGQLLENLIPYAIYTFGWKEIVVLLSLGLLIIAIYIPLFVVTRSFVIPSTLILVCFFITFLISIDALVTVSGMTTSLIFNDLDQWIIPLIEEKIVVYPYLVLPIFGLLFYGLSIAITTKAFQTKSSI